MTTGVLDMSLSVGLDVFDIDVRVETEPMRLEDAACSTDDGCGTTCEISACHSQK